ncbi:MAG: hypothetical protein AB7T06_07640 [Kofleriaceae bacterium]|jgi:hypothetical protein
MRSSFVVIALALSLGACGKEIGDECISDIDCDPNGQRFCDASQRPGGYCTIRGCDFNTCPEDSACIRFFTGGFDNRPCDHLTEDQSTDDCNLDELCSLNDLCVPRSSESRFCMATCGGDEDCRDGYECRDLDLMRQNGGEPVLETGPIKDNDGTKFCAVKPGI